MASQRISGALTAEQLRAALDYEPTTGVFRWRERQDVLPRVNKRFVGKEAGGLDGQYGYRTIRLHNALYQAHRLAWLYMTGEWPSALVDHKNCVPDDNKWSNLRLATQAENKTNKKLEIGRNSSGFKGVSRLSNGSGWFAQITSKGKNHYLGTFETPEAAHAAYVEASAHLHGEFANPG